MFSGGGDSNSVAQCVRNRAAALCAKSPGGSGGGACRASELESDLVLETYGFLDSGGVPVLPLEAGAFAIFIAATIYVFFSIFKKVDDVLEKKCQRLMENFHVGVVINGLMTLCCSSGIVSCWGMWNEMAIASRNCLLKDKCWGWNRNDIDTEKEDSFSGIFIQGFQNLQKSIDRNALPSGAGNQVKVALPNLIACFGMVLLAAVVMALKKQSLERAAAPVPEVVEESQAQDIQVNASANVNEGQDQNQGQNAGDNERETEQENVAIDRDHLHLPEPLAAREMPVHFSDGRVCYANACGSGLGRLLGIVVFTWLAEQGQKFVDFFKVRKIIPEENKNQNPDENKNQGQGQVQIGQDGANANSDGNGIGTGQEPEAAAAMSVGMGVAAIQVEQEAKVQVPLPLSILSSSFNFNENEDRVAQAQDSSADLAMIMTPRNESDVNPTSASNSTTTETSAAHPLLHQRPYQVRPIWRKLLSPLKFVVFEPEPVPRSVNANANNQDANSAPSKLDASTSSTSEVTSASLVTPTSPSSQSPQSPAPTFGTPASSPTPTEAIFTSFAPASTPVAVPVAETETYNQASSTDVDKDNHDENHDLTTSTQRSRTQQLNQVKLTLKEIEQNRIQRRMSSPIGHQCENCHDHPIPSATASATNTQTDGSEPSELDDVEEAEKDDVVTEVQVPASISKLRSGTSSGRSRSIHSSTSTNSANSAISVSSVGSTISSSGSGSASGGDGDEGKKTTQTQRRSARRVGGGKGKGVGAGGDAESKSASVGSPVNTRSKGRSENENKNRVGAGNPKLW